MYVWMCGCVYISMRVYVCMIRYLHLQPSSSPNPIQSNPASRKTKKNPGGGGACIDMYVDTYTMYMIVCVAGWQVAVFFFFFLFSLSTQIVYNEDLQPCGEPELKQTSSFYFRRTAKARKRLAWAV